jgi:hypothetical protein
MAIVVGIIGEGDVEAITHATSGTMAYGNEQPVRILPVHVMKRNVGSTASFTTDHAMPSTR